MLDDVQCYRRKPNMLSRIRDSGVLQIGVSCIPVDSVANWSQLHSWTLESVAFLSIWWKSSSDKGSFRTKFPWWERACVFKELQEANMAEVAEDKW